jgi:hypothetical protein
MAKSKPFLILSLLALLVGLFGGCSLENRSELNDDPTDPPAEGSLEDEEYQTASQALAMSQGYTNQMLAELFAGIGRIDSASGSPSLAPGPGSVYASSEADSVTISYNASTGYWRIYVEVDEPDEGLTMIFNDTLQFLSSTGVVQWFDSTVVQIRCGLLLTAAAIDGNPNAPAEITLDYAQAMVVSGELWTEGVVTVTGSGDFLADMSAADSVSSCDFNFSMSTDLSSVEFDLASLDPDACPTGGTIASAGTLDWYCTGDGMTLDVAGAWEAMATYDGDQVVVVMESDGTQWNYVGPCGGL